MKKITLILFGFVVGLNCLFAQEQKQECKYIRCVQVFDTRDSKMFFEEVSSDTISFVPFTDSDRKSWKVEYPISRADFKVESKTSEGDTVEVSIYGIYYPSSFEFFWNFPDTVNDLKTIVFDRDGFMTNFLWYQKNENGNYEASLNYNASDPKQRDVEKIRNYVEEGKMFLFYFDVKLANERLLAKLKKTFPNMK